MERDHLFDAPAIQFALAKYDEACAADDLDAQQQAGLQLLNVVGYCAALDEQLQNSPSIIAARCEASGRWEEARAVYEQELAQRDPESLDVTILRGAIGLFRLLGDESRAIALCREGQAAGRRSNLEIVEQMFTRALGGLLLSVGRVAEAKEIATQRLEGSEAQNGDVRGRADALVLRARCLFAEGLLDDAQSCLDEAWKRLGKYDACNFMVGVQDSIATYWSTLAKIQRARSAFRDAQESMRRAVAKRQCVAASPFDFPTWPTLQLAGNLQTLASDLQQGGYWFQARRAAWRSRRLFARYRLDPQGRIPPNAWQRLTVSVVRIVDWFISRVTSFSTRGNQR